MRTRRTDGPLLWTAESSIRPSLTKQAVMAPWVRPWAVTISGFGLWAVTASRTGGKPAKARPEDELAALGTKLAAGTATEADKARFRKLAAKV